EIAFDDACFARLDFAAEQFHRQRILYQALNRPLQWPRAVDRVETFAGQQLFRGLYKRERNLPFGEHLSQSLELDFDDLPEVLNAQPLEDDDVINAVEKFRLERVAQLLHHPGAHFPVIAFRLLNLTRTEVGSHDDDGIFEIHR